MDKYLYNAIKAAFTSGATVEDLNKTISAVQEDLKPRTPIADYFTDTATLKAMAEGLVSESGNISLNNLVSLIAAYYCKNGFKPDKFFKSYNEFYEAIKSSFNTQMNLFKGITTWEISFDV